MESTTPLATLGSVCHRYGPGRLPGADRADVGAGYAGASAAFVGAITWMVTVVMLTNLGADVGGAGLALLALYAIPLVVPVAFVAGVLVWRALPERTPGYGAVAGLLGTLGTYVGAVMVIAAIFPFLLGGLTAPEFVQGLRIAVAYGLVGFLLTFWVALPIGCASGAIYERVGTELPGRKR